MTRLARHCWLRLRRHRWSLGSGYYVQMNSIQIGDGLWSCPEFCIDCGARRYRHYKETP